MVGSHRTCEVCGIKERHQSEKLFFSRFPLNENRCREWLRAVGKEDLVYLPIEKLHHLRHVCGDHFVKKDFTKKGRLKKYAIPKLNLTASPLCDDQLAEFPLHLALSSKPPASKAVASTSKQPVQKTTVAATQNAPAIEAVASTSKQHVLQTTVAATQNAPAIEAVASTSKQPVLQTTVAATQNAPAIEAVASTSKQPVLQTTVAATQNAPAIEAVASTSTQPVLQTTFAATQNAPATEAVASTSKQPVLKTTFAATQNAPATEAVASTSKQHVLQMTVAATQNAPAIEAVASTSTQPVLQTTFAATQNAPAIEAVPSTSKQLVLQTTFAATQNAPDTEAVASTSKQAAEKNQSEQLTSNVANVNSKGIKRRIEENLDLSPRKKKLVHQLNKTKYSLASLKKSSILIEQIESPVLREIVISAVKNQKRKLKGRRWSRKHKISALAIYKRSPKTYKYLQNILPLPSVKTLKNILKKVPMETGINTCVAEAT